jgi:voltage-gated potassium channel
VTTLATVGLGDLTPETDAGKVFTIVFVLTGVGLLAAFISMLARQMVRRPPSG